MMPNTCSVGEAGRRCASAPTRVISIDSADGEYMVGVSCERHAVALRSRVMALQGHGAIPAGSVRLAPLSAVGTDCLKGDCAPGAAGGAVAGGDGGRLL